MLEKLNTFDLINATYVAQGIQALIKLNVFDELMNEKSSIEQLSNKLSANPKKLKLLLSIAISMEMVGQRGDTYFLKKKGILLTRNVNSWERDYFIIWADGIKNAMDETENWLKNDSIAYEEANGLKLWEHYKKNRTLGASFENFQDRISYLTHIPELVAEISLQEGERFLDIAGGKGALATSLSISNPQSIGAVLDQPHMESIFSHYCTNIKNNGQHPKVSFIPGSMLEEIPRNFDTYIIKHALHDWDDDAVQIILKNISTAMRDTDRLLIIEGIKHDSNQNNVLMQTRAYEQAMWTAGNVRSYEDFENLLTESNLRITNKKDTQIFDLSILECKKNI